MERQLGSTEIEHLDRKVRFHPQFQSKPRGLIWAVTRMSALVVETLQADSQLSAQNWTNRTASRAPNVLPLSRGMLAQ